MAAIGGRSGGGGAVGADVADGGDSDGGGRGSDGDGGGSYGDGGGGDGDDDGDEGDGGGRDADDVHGPCHNLRADKQQKRQQQQRRERELENALAVSEEDVMKSARGDLGKVVSAHGACRPSAARSASDTAGLGLIRGETAGQAARTCGEQIDASTMLFTLASVPGSRISTCMHHPKLFGPPHQKNQKSTPPLQWGSQKKGP
jgi:hypothetical protein